MQLLFEWRFVYCVVCAWICACFFVHSMSGWLWQVSSCTQIWLMGTAIAKENKNQCIAICKLRRKNNNKISPTETNSENQTDDLLLLYACTVHTRFSFGDFNCILFFISFGSFLFVAVVASFFLVDNSFCCVINVYCSIFRSDAMIIVHILCALFINMK